MSGIEVAGLVLGALPLVVSGLQFYCEGVGTMKRYFRYRTGLKDLDRRIKNQQALFINVCEDLLGGLLDPIEIETLVRNPQHGSWNSASLEKRLKKRLQGSYRSYMDTIANVHVSIKGIMEKMKLDDKGNVQFSDPNAFKREYERLKFSISKKEYDTLYLHIKNDVGDLRDLTEQHLKREFSRELRSKSPRLDLFRNSAKSFYNVLLSSWKCVCKGAHTINLYLGDEILEDYSDREESDLKLPHFRVLFCYHQSMINSGTIWQRADVEFQNLRNDEEQMHISNGNGVRQPTKSKTVRFVANSKNVNSSSLKATNGSIMSRYKRIDDLCAEMAYIESRPEREFVGVIADERAKQNYFIYALEQQAVCVPKSLGKILSEGYHFTLQQRLRLGVTLAVAMLRFGQTQWLDDNWTKDEIVFLENNGQPVLEQPFVSKTLSGPLIARSVDLEVVGVQNQSLFTLGILLIELLFGAPIKSICSEANLDQVFVESSSLPVNWKALPALLNHVREKAGDRYRDAVRVCVRGDVPGPDKSFESRKFREGVHATVVAHLEATQKWFTAPSVDMLG